uniref:Secreted protein n=1 Tax=Pygocentrus nattereri TaxID=42514 RepID=A0AAR2JBE3_PYGNA
MAKYLAQIVVVGVQVAGRSFAPALRQEVVASQTVAEARDKQAVCCSVPLHWDDHPRSPEDSERLESENRGNAEEL